MRWRWKEIAALMIVACIVAPVCGEDEAGKASEEKTLDNSKPVPAKTFDLKVVNIFEPIEKEDQDYRNILFARRGVPVHTNLERTEGVKYPKFKSKEPCFGTLKMEGSYGKPTPIAIAVDESGGAGTGYDLVYVDRNGNKDLTDDAPLEEQSFESEEEKRNYSPHYFDRNINTKIKMTAWQPIRLSWPGADLPEDYRVYPFNFPRVSTLKGPGTEEKRGVTIFFRYPTMRIGKIQIGPYRYRVTVMSINLMPDFQKAAYFDYAPLDKEVPRIGYWWGGRAPNAIHQVNGHYYTLAISSDGTKLTVAPYEGKFGEFRVDFGNRSLEKSESKKTLIYGGLEGKPYNVALGNYDSEQHRYTGVEAMKLPVGDYTSSLVNVEVGDIVLRISRNYHSDGKPREYPTRLLGIKIREDQPYVFDLADTPSILFTSPAKQTSIKQGETILVKPVLIDPKLRLMFREIRDISDLKDLAPTVEIHDSKGKLVSSGTAEYG